MRNPLTFQVESFLGTVFISLSALFFIGLIFTAIENFNSDLDIMSVDLNSPRIRSVSQTELILIRKWAKENSIAMVEGRGYKHLIRKYPSRPWLSE